MVKFTWLAHAAFLIEGDGLRIITDPYDPQNINVRPITEPADIVIRSSDNDRAHCYVETIPSGFDLITATDIVESGARAKGLDVKAIWSQESLVHKDIPRDNAMYRFTLDGIQISHMGDVGNFLTDDQMSALSGTDVLLALAGGPPTIELGDLYKVIQTVKPRIIIPMHYRIPGPKFFMLPVTELTRYFPENSVEWIQGSQLEISKDTLPDEQRIFVLKSSLIGDAE